MRRYVLPLVIWAIASVGALPALEIEGPTEPIEPGEYVQLFVRGLDEAKLPQARVIHWPRNRVVVVPARTWGGDPFIWFGARQSGDYFLAVAVPDDGTLEYAEAIIQVGESPPPPPPPPPPGPVKNLTILVVEESSRRKPLEFMTLSHRSMLNWVRDNGHRLRLVDKDVKDEKGRVPVDLAPWIERAGESLPRVFFVDADKKLHYEGALPETGARFLTLIKKYGAEE